MALLDLPEPKQTSADSIHGVPPFGTTHACCAGEVERNVSNLMAHLARARSHSDLLK